MTRERQLLQIAIGAVCIGVLDYVFERVEQSIYFLLDGWSLNHQGGRVFGGIGDFLPTFVHDHAFILLPVAIAILAGIKLIPVRLAGLPSTAYSKSPGSIRLRNGSMDRYVFSLLVITMLLTGCGGGGITCEVSRSPSISSSPPTTATIGYTYRYYVDASYTCFPFVCGGVDSVSLPPGATLSYGTVYWTPTDAYLNQSVHFSVATKPDSCGSRATQSWNVRVIAAPVISSFTASRTGVNPGESVTLTPVFSNGNGYIEGLGPVTSGVSVNTPVLNTTTSYNLVVTNAAGDERRQVITIEVLQPPEITSFTASPSVITTGDGVYLNWSASGNYSTATLEPVGVDVLNNRSYTDSPTTSTNYTLTLSNDAGNIATANVQVLVVPPPVINSFTSSEATSTFRGSVLLTADYEFGTGEVFIEGLDGTRIEGIEPNIPLDSGELLRNTNFRLKVTNIAGRAVEELLTVPITGPGTFQLTKGEPVFPARWRHRAVRLLDGRVFIAGGKITTELFDPVTETYTAGPDLLEYRENFGMALLNDGRVLMVGGYREDSTRLLTAEIYDPGTNSITSAGAVPATDMVSPDSATLQDGRVLIVHTSRGQGVEIFDPLTELFLSAAQLNTIHACTNINLLNDGRVIVIDGSYPVYPHRASEIFDPLTESFYLTGAITQSRCYFSSLTLADGRVLIAGGGDEEVETYDPGTGLFVVITTQQYPSSEEGSATQLHNENVLVTGKDYAAELFDPLTNSFSLTGGMNYNRRWYTATLLEDGRVLVHGGCHYEQCYAEIYTP